MFKDANAAELNLRTKKMRDVLIRVLYSQPLSPNKRSGELPEFFLQN